MVKAEKRLSGLPGIQEDQLKLDRNLLKDRAAEMLRDSIGSGRIPEGTKLTEREVSRLLGISRMPAHEALTILEAEGLVVSRPDGRYVIELTEKDVRDIHALRCTLEQLAVELAAANANPKNRAALQTRLQALEEAVASGNPEACTKCDMALHRAIWQQAENPHLLRVLDSVRGGHLCARRPRQAVRQRRFRAHADRPSQVGGACHRRGGKRRQADAQSAPRKLAERIPTHVSNSAPVRRRQCLTEPDHKERRIP
jgi:DNA-binding GntR family transcriptional regulator